MAFNPPEFGASSSSTRGFEIDLPPLAGVLEQPNSQEKDGPPPPETDDSWQNGLNTELESTNRLYADSYGIESLKSEEKSEPITTAQAEETKPGFDLFPSEKQWDGVAGAITEKLKVHNQANLMEWQNTSPNQPAFAQLAKLRANEVKIPLPGAENLLPSETTRPEEVVTNLKGKSEIGIEASDNMPLYKEQSRARQEPLNLLFDSETQLANEFKGDGIRYKSEIKPEGLLETHTNRNFESLRTFLGTDGKKLTAKLDRYNRPLTKIEANYADSGDVSFKLSKFSYAENGRINPFPVQSQVYEYADGKGSVSNFEHGQDNKPILVSSKDWV